MLYLLFVKSNFFFHQLDTILYEDNRFSVEIFAESLGEHVCSSLELDYLLLFVIEFCFSRFVVFVTLLH